MATINWNSIAQKCKEWSETTDGKRRCRAAVAESARAGRTVTGCGDKIITLDDMRRLSVEMIQTLQVAADDASYALPESVKAHFNSLDYIVTEVGDGLYEVAIYFRDDLSRPSLLNDQGYEGVHNIVALFNNGYVASNYTYGWWENHRPTGDWSSYASGGYDATDTYIRSKIGRPSLHFMQRAVQDFLSKYQTQYNIQVELDPYSYDGNYMGSPTGTVLPIPND